MTTDSDSIRQVIDRDGRTVNVVTHVSDDLHRIYRHGTLAESLWAAEIIVRNERLAVQTLEGQAKR